MKPKNDTEITEFLLLGFAEDVELQPLIFGLFLSMYLVTVLGNLLIILATILDSHLPTPMYFFLSNLSFVDICFTSTTVPKMLVNIQTQIKAITYEACITQIHFFVLFIELDILLLTVMAYDRYVTIYHPLHYMVIMKPLLCELLILVSWVVSVLYAFLQSLLVLCLSFCMDLEIPHYFCELNQVFQLACSDAFLNEVVIHVAAILLRGGPSLAFFTLIPISFPPSVQSHEFRGGTNPTHLWFSPLCGLLILLHEPRCVPQFCSDPKLTFNFNSLCDVYCGHPHAEPLHLQSEESGSEERTEETL
ncbi:Olfactory receptor 7A17 [Sciurus carolinensis]|uniref:Olfactory receptor n=1 Tax=Sciurus carolinensis TaxID=30640 RepID=A0AA41T1T5_SCICA|nr:Olfactory receptor 7A17 [Sciurus carolinensis]